MSECAFCPCTAKLTLEHITSAWMGRAFPNRKKFKVTDHQGKIREWISKGLELKVPVVCGPCNNGWMNEIEDKHAKPVLLPLMLGKVTAPFGEKEAHSLSLFAFKTAVVIDHGEVLSQNRKPFFSKRQRYAFKQFLMVPANVDMWLAPYMPHRDRRRFDIRIRYGKQISLLPDYTLQMLVCTLGLGSIAFQVLAHKQIGFVRFQPRTADFDNVGIPFYPQLEPNYVWPGFGSGKMPIKSNEEFVAFSRRWDEIIPEAILDPLSLG